jgi:hypothetical protein
MFIPVSWHLLSRLLHYVHVLPRTVTLKQGMCVEVTNMERHGTVLGSTAVCVWFPENTKQTH